MPANGVELYIIRNFLTHDECASLIALIDANRVPSPVVSDDPVPSYRTSETCYLYAGPDAVTAVETKLDLLTGLEPRTAKRYRASVTRSANSSSRIETSSIRGSSIGKISWQWVASGHGRR
jgi:hypothetical protein